MESTGFLFDGSDQMPGEVGAGTFWKDMTAWISGQEDLDTALTNIDESWPAVDQQLTHQYTEIAGGAGLAPVPPAVLCWTGSLVGPLSERFADDQGTTALVTVVIGIGGAMALYYLFNKIAELLPGKWEDRVKPYFYILPAFLAIALYLVYPAVLTFINSFKDRFSREWVGTENYTDLLSTRRSATRCSTPCCGS